MTNRGPRPLCLTMGDPAGIGPDITLGAWSAREEAGLKPFVAYANAEALATRAAQLGLEIPIEPVGDPEAACDVFSAALPVIDIALRTGVRCGHPDPANAGSVLHSIESAVEAVMEGRGAAVVTNPIAKSVLYKSGFRHPGHTEYLAALAELHDPSSSPTPVMMLAARELRVVPVTIHIPLSAVAAQLSPNLLERCIRVTDRAMREDFGIASPRLAVTGLNPHAGEDGTMGTEERDVIVPVLKRLQADGLDLSGPHPADTLFHEKARARYDAAIAMYHDQALIPIKTLAFDRGVNVTLGLPFVRTSPDHGTAFDIAGSGEASADSLIEACKLAGQMADARRAGSGVI